MAIGAGLYLAPTQALIRLFFLNQLVGYEEGLLRAVGLTVAVIGWLYAMAGRTGSDSFALATVLDRLAIPFLLAYLYRLGLPLGLVLPFAFLDPLLGIATWWIWRRERAREGAPAVRTP